MNLIEVEISRELQSILQSKVLHQRTRFAFLWDSFSGLPVYGKVNCSAAACWRDLSRISRSSACWSTTRAGEDLDPDGERLLGLYAGVPLTERESGNAGELPEVIYLFRQPYLELELTSDEFCEEIATTLIHEIAHYFGIDDDHLDEIVWG